MILSSCWNDKPRGSSVVRPRSCTFDDSNKKRDAHINAANVNSHRRLTTAQAKRSWRKRLTCCIKYRNLYFHLSELTRSCKCSDSTVHERFSRVRNRRDPTVKILPKWIRSGLGVAVWFTRSHIMLVRVIPIVINERCIPIAVLCTYTCFVLFICTLRVPCARYNLPLYL